MIITSLIDTSILYLSISSISVHSVHTLHEMKSIQTAIFDSEICPLKQKSTSLPGCRQRS